MRMAVVSVQPEFDVVSGEQYLNGIPHDTFAAMRDLNGLYWHRYPTPKQPDGGFWAVTRAEDVKEISTNPEIYSSGVGHTSLWDLDGQALESRRSIIDSDAPDHTRLRRIVSRAFTPKQLRSWEDATRSIARSVLDDMAAAGQGDLVTHIAAPLPIRVILTMLGVPLDDADYMVELTNYLIEVTADGVSLPDDAFGNTTPVELLPFSTPASHALFAYGDELGAKRSANPTDDLVSLLVGARDHEERLSAQEYRNFFHILILGGNETTRTAISQSMLAFSDHPEQWDRLVADPSLIDSAVEEMLRWSTPLMHMRRTAVVDTTLAGTDIAAGDKVVMWYSSANRDPRWFDRPDTFDIARSPNPHQSFGAGGPHFCLGAFLARMEMRILLEEMLGRGMRLSAIGEPQRAPSNFVNGIIALDVEVHESGPGVGPGAGAPK